jgi:hypothetical protein
MNKNIKTTRKLLAGLALTFASTLAFAQSVNLTATPPSGPAPLNVTLAWSSTGIDSCIENGVVVSPTGSRTVNGILVDTTYNIACTGGKDYSDVSWTAPTHNTDGTPLTNLGGFKIYYATTQAGVANATPIIIANPAATTYRINGQPNSVYYYQMTAYNTLSVESARTGFLTNTINRVAANASTLVDITSEPNPPGGVVIAPPQTPPSLATTAPAVYNLVKRTNGFVMVYVGQVPLNTPCDITQTVNGYYVVPINAVTWSGSVRPAVVVAQCSIH